MATQLRSSILRFCVVLALVAMAALNLQEVEGWMDPSADNRYYVKVRNELPRTLTVHCKSGDKDQGIHYVAPGQEYVFKFILNFWGTTLYWCRFVDGQRWNSFQVWTPPGMFPPHNHVPCWKCLWVARVDGFWRAEDRNTLTIEQPWRQDRYWPPAADQIPI